MDFEQSSKRYYQWLELQGVNSVKRCSIEDLRSEDKGRGVFAKEPINQGETIYEIPRLVIFNVDNCGLLQDRPELKDILLLLNQWEVLIVLLLYEIKVKGSQSKWISYFQVLPILDEENYQFNQLMFWSDDELKALHPSLITERIGRDLADGMYRKLFPNYVIHKMGLVELENTSLSEYHKIASLIMSYLFDIEKLNENGYVDEGQGDDGDEEGDEDNNGADGIDGDKPSPNSTLSDGEGDAIKNDSFLKSMIPLADTLNADTNKHNASLEYLKDKLIIKAIKPIRAGDQIYNTYSDHPNSEILRRYGYVESCGSKHDFGEIPLSIIKKHFTGNTNNPNPVNEELFDEILEIFTRIAKEEDEAEDDVVDFVLDSYDCFITGEIIIELIILLQCLTIVTSINSLNPMTGLSFDSKFQLIRRIYRKCIQLIESRKLTKLLLQNYKLILTCRLEQYPEVAREDFTLKEVDNSRTGMAKVVLKSEYKSLKTCLDINKAFKVDGTMYSFIDDDKLIRNIVKRKFDLPFEPSKKSKT